MNENKSKKSEKKSVKSRVLISIQALTLAGLVGAGYEAYDSNVQATELKEELAHQEQLTKIEEAKVEMERERYLVAKKTASDTKLMVAAYEKANTKLKKTNKGLEDDKSSLQSKLKKSKGQVEALKAKKIKADAAREKARKASVASAKKTEQKKVVAASSPKATAKKTEVAKSKPKSSSSDYTSWRKMTVSATGYTAFCAGCSGVTATGIDLRANPNQKVIAVDPRVIPLGSKVYVEGYGYAVAGDTGGAIKGNKIDLYMKTKSEALGWGRRSTTIYIK